MRRLARWWALPIRERLLFPVLLLALPLVDLCLRLLGYQRTQGLLERLGALRLRPASHPTDLAQARRLVTLLAIAGRHTLRPATCLRQALLLHLLLRWRGLAPEIRFGVRRTDTGPEMHAWVELDGHSLDMSGNHHRPFQASPPADAAP